MFSITNSLLDGRREQQLNGYSWQVARLQFRWLDGKRLLVDKVVEFDKECVVRVGNVLLLEESGFTLGVTDGHCLDSTIHVAAELHTLALSIEYWESVCLVVLEEIRHSLFVFLNSVLRESPCRTFGIDMIGNRNEWESVLLRFTHLFESVESEDVKNGSRNTFHVTLEAIQVFIIPHLYPFSGVLSIFIEVVILTGKEPHASRDGVVVRIELIAVDEGECARLRLTIFIEESNYGSVRNGVDRVNSLIETLFHSHCQPAFLEVQQRQRILERFLFVTTLGCQLKLHIVTTHMRITLDFDDALESQSGTSDGLTEILLLIRLSRYWHFLPHIGI